MRTRGVMIGFSLAAAGGAVVAASAFLPWWKLCIELGVDPGGLCAQAGGNSEWPGVVEILLGVGLLALGIVGLTVRQANARAMGISVIALSAASALLAIVSIGARDAIVGVSGLELALGPFIALAGSAGAGIGGAFVAAAREEERSAEPPSTPPMPGTDEFTV